MGEPLLRMDKISKRFGPVQALSGVSIDLHAGEVLALMGENGAGKSTLMNVLSGALHHYDGQIYVLGEHKIFQSPHAAREAGIAKIHQELQMVKELSVAENMFIGREVVKRGFVQKKVMEQKAREYLGMLDLAIDPAVSVKTLRVGEQQMVEIAKALSLNARILIMDEPTSAISEQESDKLFTVIRRLAKEGVGIIYITHRMEEVFAIADRLTVLRDGQYISTVCAKETTREEVIAMMVGRKIKDMYPKVSVPIGDEVLRVNNLCLKSDGSFRRTLKNISFTLNRGEVLGIAGLLGSGRSELFESLFGMHPRDVSGEIFIDRKRVTIKGPLDAIAQGISFATEDRKGKGLVLPRSIGENMSLPRLRQFSRLGFMNRALEREKWDEQMTSMRIKAPSYNALCETLSGGNQQKVVLGRWLITSPKVLLLDEPTRGIDVGAKAEIYQLINNLASLGMGIIVISSELPEIIGISDRILTFCEGRVTGEFSRESATQEKLLDAATMREESAV